MRARAYVSGDQQYELYVNGTRAGKGQAYCYPDSQYYETLDVTHLLVPGSANAVAVLYGWQGADEGPPRRPSRLHRAGVGAPRRRIVGDNHHRRDVAGAPGGLVAGDPARPRRGSGRLHREHQRPRHSGRLGEPGIRQRNVGGGVGARACRHETVDAPGLGADRIVQEPVPALTLTTLSSGAVVADFGKVYAAVPTVTFHQGVAGRLITMRAGYLLDEPGGAAFIGIPGQVSTEHGTQHTNMHYSYIQRGGAEQFTPFDYLGFRYFQIDNPGETLAPSDVVASPATARCPTSTPLPSHPRSPPSTPSSS